MATKAQHRRLLKVIKSRGISQSRIARHLGISQPAVNQWTTKPTGFPAKKYLEKLAEYLNTTVEYIETGAGGETPTIQTIAEVQNTKLQKSLTGLRDWAETRTQDTVPIVPVEIRQYYEGLATTPAQLALPENAEVMFTVALGLQRLSGCREVSEYLDELPNCYFFNYSSRFPRRLNLN